MTLEQARSLAALGRVLAAARDDGVLAAEEYGTLAASLAAGILTGNIAMDDYAAVHEALARILEAAFDGSLSSEGTAAVEAAGDPGDFLGAELEVVGDVWGEVEMDGEQNFVLENFLTDAFDMERSTFGETFWFAAPLRLTVDRVREAARRAGLALIAREEGEKVPSEGLFTEGENDAPAAAGKLLLGWGDRRFTLALS